LQNSLLHRAQQQQQQKNAAVVQAQNHNTSTTTAATLSNSSVESKVRTPGGSGNDGNVSNGQSSSNFEPERPIGMN
jgi:hypothetical protein